MSNNPGPGQYNANNGAFRLDFISAEAERKIMSQDGGPRSVPFKAVATKNTISKPNEIGSGGGETKMQTATNFTSELAGNPSYTIKEGGTLKKKIQPMAADNVSRDYSFVPVQQLKSVTAPGLYEVKSSFSTVNQSKLPHYAVAQKLKDLDLYQQQVAELNDNNYDMLDDANPVDLHSNEG